MSQTITTAFVQQFNTNVYILSQQMGSKLGGLVRVESQSSLKAFYDRLAAAPRPQTRTSRHQDTPLVEQVHTRRACTIADYVLADLVDREDQIRMLINPESLYAQNFARSFGREKDIVIIEAITAAAESGQFGGSTVSWPSGNILTSGGAGLTVARVRQAKRVLDTKDVKEEGRVFVVSAQAMEDLLETTEVTSSDYNTVKALVQGSIEGDNWMGFKWVRLSDDILPLNRRGTDNALDRSCYAFQRDGLVLGMGQDMRTEMDRRPDKMNSLQVMVTGSFGAVRVDEDAFVEIHVREA